MDPAHVSEAAEYFKNLQWKAIDCLMKADGYFAQEKEKFRQRVKAMDTRNVLQINGPESREESLEEMASDFVDLEEKRTDLIWQFEEHLGSGERRIFGKRVTTGEYRNWRKKTEKSKQTDEKEQS